MIENGNRRSAISPHAVCLNGINFAYERQRAMVLNDISLNIAAGKVTAILGPNGSGKTTLMHIVLGLLKPMSGELQIAGLRHGEQSRRQMAQLIAIVAQEEGVVFDLPVFDYVLLGRGPHLGLLDTPRERDWKVAMDAIQTVGIEAIAHRPVPSLSGGERQLAAIARALAQEPQILLLDEPTSHLDLANQRRTLMLIGELRDKGVTVVFTTHDPNAAASVADEAILLREGKLLAVGPVDVVLNGDALTQLYRMPIRVEEIDGRRVVLVW